MAKKVVMKNKLLVIKHSDMKIISLLKSRMPLKQKIYLQKIFYQLSPFSFKFGFNKDLNSLLRKINLYFLIFPSKGKDFINEISFLNYSSKVSNEGSFIFPYSFVYDYDINHINVFKDDVKGLYFVIYKGKRLYYSRDYHSEAAVKEHYNYISIEQDEKSPHRYINENFNVEDNDVVIDIGAAEGNFSLEVVERAKVLYIFESDNKWIEALNATFEPWIEKVHIIKKFISNIDNDECATLNTILEDNPVNFIKMDVEGAEVMILENSKRILDNNSTLKLALCCYHRKNDAKKIKKILFNNKFNYCFSDGYMLFIYERLSPPYFRKGLIQAQKIKNN